MSAPGKSPLLPKHRRFFHETSLGKPPGPDLREALGRVHEAVSLAFPLKPKHLRELPLAVEELSLRLTAERGQGRKYWGSPRLTGAYLHYFMPWNLLRLAWLLPGLPLRLRPGDQVLDLGSGPLTLPLGLWLARPELRKTDLRFLCTDAAPQPLALGLDIFHRVAGQPRTGNVEGMNWQLRTKRGRLEAMNARLQGRARLITVGNVLNELPQSGTERLEEYLENLFLDLDQSLTPGGQIFLLEPGTRLGGKLLGLLRGLALGYGYLAEAPCTHQAPCPLAETNKAGGWCHFSFPAAGAPPALEELSLAAGLGKRQLHLSCLLLRKPIQDLAVSGISGGKSGTREKSLEVRIISDPIRLPGQEETARYVCSSMGLGLLRDAAGIKSGQTARATLLENKTKDPKSNAWNMVRRMDRNAGSASVCKL
ncbi:MAG: hypothetical protein FWF99_00275 [Desulfovibrionaceae bacterium]|nr:hypothetical protein [Desulfovibrionaceae bacterium]